MGNEWCGAEAVGAFAVDPPTDDGAGPGYRPVSILERFRSRPWRGVAVLATGVALALAPFSSAGAHYVYEELAWFQNIGGECGYIWSEVSHGSGYGYAKARNEDSYSWWCGTLEKTKSPNQIGARWSYYVWSNSTGTWNYCTDIGWRYNTLYSSDKVNAYSFSNYPCGGPQYYGTYSHGRTYVNSSVGELYDTVMHWSGYQWIAADGSPSPK